MLNKRADKLELLRIAEAVALEKSIDKELIINSMETGIAKAAKSKFGQDNEIKVIINRDSGDIEIFRKLIIVEKPENNNTEVLNENSNMPMIEPSELQNNGGQLNKDSQEFASMPPSVSMNVIKGGDNSTISSNQTYTNIAENTTTSDTNAKKIFKAS